MTFDKILKDYCDTLKKYTIAFTILTRIHEFYPHIFEECSNKEEVDELLEKKDK